MQFPAAHRPIVFPSGPAARRAQAFSRTIAAVRHWLDEANRRRRGRNALAQMSDTQLKDIGITRMQAELEAAKPFWR